MPASLALTKPNSGVWFYLNQLQNDEPRFTAVGIFLALLVPVFLVAAMVDDRLLLGVNIWLKPTKFAVSMSIFMLTLALFARYLPEAFRQKNSYKVFSASAAFSALAEMIWVAGAAAYGTASHFNFEHPFLSAIYPVMGAFAVLLTSPSAVYAWQINRNKSSDLPPIMKFAIVTGLALTLPLTLMTAGTMAQLGGHAVGGTGLDTVSIPLMGWLRNAGDLRVGHFFATHALHFIPVVGVVSYLVFGANKTWPILAFSLLFTAFVVFTFVRALNGIPFI